MERLLSKSRKALTLALTNPREFGYRLSLFLRETIRRPLLNQPQSAKSGKIRRNDVVFRIDLALDPVMESMYFGTYQTDLIALMERILRPGDSFIDVGANVGYVSAIALGLVGRKGQVHAFEPVPQYADRLRQVQQDNPRYHLQVNPMALADQPGTATICITNLPNIGWNTMVPQFMGRKTVQAEVEVSVTTLDHYLATTAVPNLRLIKIDTEGYEFPVIKGLQTTLAKLDPLPILVVEIAPAAYPNMNTSLVELAAFMETLGYRAWDMAIAHPVEITELTETTDVVFLPQSMRSPVER
ncbi:MAG: FkbM family methyltransferase [Cyanobacteria bacterium J06638_22]